MLMAAFLALAYSAAPAGAAVPHTVRPGESLSSIAAADGLSATALAAANGLSPAASLVSGSVVQIPAAGSDSAGSEPVADGAGVVAPGPAPMGGYTVRPGDTLSAIAARSGVPTGEVAWMNGLNPSQTLLAGTALKLPTGAPGSGSVVGPTPVRIPAAAPYPTPVRVAPSTVAAIAQQNGVPPALATAVAAQESGFNNGAVSSANARGVMQVMPGTWGWIQGHLVASPLDPASATDNIKAGVLYLGRLLRDTGGSTPAAVASYYQGLGSLRSIGMLPDTRRYVSNVLALSGRYGG